MQRATIEALKAALDKAGYNQKDKDRVLKEFGGDMFLREGAGDNAVAAEPWRLTSRGGGARGPRRGARRWCGRGAGSGPTERGATTAASAAAGRPCTWPSAPASVSALGRARGRRRSHGTPVGEHLGEHLDELGVELDAGLAAQLVDRGLVRDRGAVRPAGDHRLVGVDDRHDPRPDRDLAAGEAVGIAAAVVPLVVVEHDRRRVAQRAGLLEDDLADLRVLRHDPPLGRREVAGLGQDLVRDRELAEVVEQARGADALELALAAGRSRGRAATEASAIIVDGLPAHAGRPASVAISASWAAAIAASRRRRWRGCAPRRRSARGGSCRRRRSRGTRRPGRGRAPWPSTARRPRRGRARRAGGPRPGPPATPARQRHRDDLAVGQPDLGCRRRSGAASRRARPPRRRRSRGGRSRNSSPP